MTSLIATSLIVTVMLIMVVIISAHMNISAVEDIELEEREQRKCIED